MVAKKETPSLSARASKASDADEPKSHRAAPKVKHEVVDLEPVRFSRRQDLEKHDSPIGKIVLYIVVVIVVGVGLTLLVQNYITRQNTNTASDTTTPPETTQSDIPNTTISKSIAADTSASSVNSNDVFSDSDLSLGSAGNDVSAADISTLKHEVYTSFTRTSWTITGLKSGLPSSKVTYNATNETVTVAFSGVKTVDSGFLQEIPVTVGNVTSITGTKDDTGVTFVLKLDAPSKYFAFITDGNIVSLDIKTDAQLTKPNPAPEPTPTPAPAPTPTPTPSPEPVPPTSDSGAPAAPHYDNTLSQVKQYVASAVTGNTVFNDTYYYIDYGPGATGGFQFSWAMRNTCTHEVPCETAIPNASAELKQASDGSYYIEVLIHNLAQDLLYSTGKTKPTVTIDTSRSNYKDMELKSFANGISTYWIMLKHKGNFRLHSTQTYNSYQLLGIQLAD